MVNISVTLFNEKSPTLSKKTGKMIHKPAIDYNAIYIFPHRDTMAESAARISKETSGRVYGIRRFLILNLQKLCKGTLDNSIYFPTILTIRHLLNDPLALENLGLVYPPV